MKKDEDRRVLKTRQGIQDALFSLMQEKAYSRITIQEIIDRANVGRSTFYSHYETKEDLLISCVGDLLEALNQYMVNQLEEGDTTPRLLPVDELFEHIREQNKVLKGLMKAESSDLFFDKVQAYWNSSIERYIKSGLPENYNPPVPIVILTNHITGTLINLLKWWINNKMVYSPAQMDHYFHLLINPCLENWKQQRQTN